MTRDDIDAHIAIAQGRGRARSCWLVRRGVVVSGGGVVLMVVVVDDDRVEALES